MNYRRLPGLLKILVLLLLTLTLTCVPFASVAQDASSSAEPAAPAPAAPDMNTVVATVGGQTITEADLAFAAEDLGQSLNQVPQDQIAGHAVFIGSTALASGDMFTSPFGPQLPGVEILATAAANIDASEFLRRDGTTFVIDLIVAYTKKAAANYLDVKRELVDLAIEESNESFRQSGIGHVKLRLVHAYQTDYVE